MTGPLSGVRVLDLTRLAPGPYGSMLLADLGAEVIVVGGGRSGLPVPALSRGKEFITLDLKTGGGRDALHRLAAESDVLVEGFRPGVADRLGAGYAELNAINPRLVYCSLTGYGQTGPLAQRSGHDINYLAVGGALGTFGPPGGPPVPPLNLVADFAGGGLLAAFGVVSALYERERSGVGQYVDVAMVDGVLSMMGMNFADWGIPTLPRRGEGVLTGTMPAYRCYSCADGRYVAVGALEYAFFENLWRSLDLAGDVPDHLDPANFGTIEKALTDAFRLRPMAEWAEHFKDIDACVTPVLEPDELGDFPQIAARYENFRLSTVPTVPVYSRTPAEAGPTETADATERVLSRFGLSSDDAAKVAGPRDGAAVTGLCWPPLL
ncbi:CoA transferase [Saccharopolyspora rhizosphaerae]|uniref:CoA transferase n=1 Tax=Saccharopolyspora rhizosphaerae TaxID=2492662 RepID=A0A3R8R6V2_9PSEU|nr:CaiB/BaiF CoA-transferase family protein [Saccharopolyspora rhizosphaerae]RRO19754.1 CoA transferase [Saccharopolyspora rhizosphaerae]